MGTSRLPSTAVFIASLQTRAERELRKILAAYVGPGHSPAWQDLIIEDFLAEVGQLVLFACKPLDTTRPAKMDIKGSSAIFAATDNRVVVSRNPEKDKARKADQPRDEWRHLHDTEVTVEKQRETGWEGTYRLKCDAKTYTYGKWEEGEHKAAAGAQAESREGRAGKNAKARSSPQFPLGVGWGRSQRRATNIVIKEPVAPPSSKQGSLVVEKALC